KEVRPMGRWVIEHDTEEDLLASIARGEGHRHYLTELDPELFAAHTTVFKALAAAHRAGRLAIHLDDHARYCWAGVDDWVVGVLRGVCARAGILTDAPAAIARLERARWQRQLAAVVQDAQDALDEAHVPKPETLEVLRDLLEAAPA